MIELDPLCRSKPLSLLKKYFRSNSLNQALLNPLLKEKREGDEVNNVHQEFQVSKSFTNSKVELIEPNPLKTNQFSYLSDSVVDETAIDTSDSQSEISEDDYDYDDQNSKQSS